MKRVPRTGTGIWGCTKVQIFNTSQNMSIKTNYKIGERVIITGAGKFQDLQGIVINHNLDPKYNPLVIDLNVCGTWSFSYASVSPLQKEKTEPLTLKGEIKSIIIAPIGKQTFPPKRKYNRKDKNKEVKKRKYTKKPIK